MPWVRVPSLAPIAVTDRPIAAVILAGGAARRLGGGDKPLLDLGGQPILARIMAALSGIGPVVISANGDPERFTAFGLPVLSDGPFAGQGPLAGILAALDWANERGAGTLLSVPGDTPFLPAGLAASLAPAPAYAHCERAHYLVALWPVSARYHLRRLLSAPAPRDVAAFAQSIGMRPVVFPDMARDCFLNVNTPEDLAAARTRAEAQR
ncbi:MAG: molybdenum cofactor guanylyltransferase [Acetobacteraceae bacterium]